MNHEKEALHVNIELKVILSELLPQLEPQFFLVCNCLRRSDNLLSICSFPSFVRILKFFLIYPKISKMPVAWGAVKRNTTAIK